MSAFKSTTESYRAVGTTATFTTSNHAAASGGVPSNFEESQQFLRARAERLTTEKWAADRAKEYAKIAATLKAKGTYTEHAFQQSKAAFDRTFNPRAESALRDALWQAANVDAQSVRGPVTGTKWEGVGLLPDETPRFVRAC